MLADMPSSVNASDIQTIRYFFLSSFLNADVPSSADARSSADAPHAKTQTFLPLLMLADMPSSVNASDIQTTRHFFLSSCLNTDVPSYADARSSTDAPHAKTQTFLPLLMLADMPPSVNALDI